VARDDREGLRKVVDRLSPEFEPPFEGRWLEGAARPTFKRQEGAPAPRGAGSEDEALVEDLRRALARLAASIGAESLPPERRQMVQTALDGAELVMRGQLTIGACDRLPPLLPTFVFLIALPIVQQDRALSISERVRELVDPSING
jgi:hypothetical protein